MVHHLFLVDVLELADCMTNDYEQKYQIWHLKSRVRVACAQMRQKQGGGSMMIAAPEIFNELKLILDQVAFNNLGVCCFNMILDSKKENKGGQQLELELEIAEILCDMQTTSLLLG